MCLTIVRPQPKSPEHLELVVRDSGAKAFTLTAVSLILEHFLLGSLAPLLFLLPNTMSFTSSERFLLTKFLFKLFTKNGSSMIAIVTLRPSDLTFHLETRGEVLEPNTGVHLVDVLTPRPGTSNEMLLEV